MDYRARLVRLQSLLEENRLDALLVTHLPNIRYLCGFSGSAGALLVTGRRALFFSDGRYTVQAKEEVRAARVVIARKAAVAAAANWMVAHPAASRLRLGIEGRHLNVETYGWLASTLGSGFRLRPAPPLVEQLRMIKDENEIELIRAAAVLGASLFQTVLKCIRQRRKETEAAAQMEFAARKAGAEGMSFPTIVVSGERSALPHGKPDDVPIRSDAFVVCDFGVILSGYCSDRTRTVYVGSPTRDARRVYQAVQAAQAEAVAAIAPGRTVGEVDRVARKVLQKSGVSRYFTHSTGHGVGLEIHEAPRLAAGQAEVLQPGMVVTVEPGVYLPGRWGVRIEDMVVVTGQGCDVLAPSSTDLIAV